MERMKKITVMLLVFILAFSAISCTPTETNVNTNNETAVVNENNENTATETPDNDNNETTAVPDDTEPVEEVDRSAQNQAERDAIDDQYKWELSKVYANTEAFMADVEAVKASLEMFENNQASFVTNYQTFSETLLAFEKYRRMTDTLYVFATLQAHTDTANPDFSDLEDIAANLDNDLSEATSYFLPVIANMDESTLNSYMSNAEMANIQPYIDSIMADKQYILSVEEEALLAQAQILYETPESIYDAFKYNFNIDEYLPEPDINLFWTGTRDDKDAILQDFFLKTKLGNDLIAEIYESEIKKNTFFAKARGFENALASALNTDGMTLDAYNKVFEITYDNLDLLHRWTTLKKEILGLEDGYHYYDAYTPLIANPYSFMEYETGKALIYEALAPLGSQYIEDLKLGFDSRWADVYPTATKYEGGYQWGSYDTNPFVLLNFNNYLTDVSTAAHEMGHALNFKYSNEKQPYFAASVPIFNAEIASTTNEAMVLEHIINNASDNAAKQKAILDYINLIENTIFTQMIYADFEKQAYEAYEAGEPINAELFNTIMGDVYKKYYGPDYILDETATYQWSEIPHFYNAYYVYKYATGLSAGLTFADNILNGTEEQRVLYLDYLAAGSSEPPLTLLKTAGVDFSTGEPLQRAYDKFESLLDQFEDTLKK